MAELRRRRGCFRAAGRVRRRRRAGGACAAMRGGGTQGSAPRRRRDRHRSLGLPGRRSRAAQDRRGGAGAGRGACYRRAEAPLAGDRAGCRGAVDGEPCRVGLVVGGARPGGPRGMDEPHGATRPCRRPRSSLARPGPTRATRRCGSRLSRLRVGHRPSCRPAGILPTLQTASTRCWRRSRENAAMPSFEGETGE